MSKKSNVTTETNVIYCADNLDVMRNLPSESIDFIYVDPPFFSQRNYETIWGDKNDTASFNDRWKGGIYHFTEWMKPRLEQMHRLLTPEGSIVVQLDWHAFHYIKVLMDEIFGYGDPNKGHKLLRNEIVWWQSNKYTGNKNRWLCNTA